MSGHSKWANIKREKAKTDASRGKNFTKLGREIAVAVKMGGSNPQTNSRLALAIIKAKQGNMSNDTIDRGIKKAAGDMSGVNYENIMYEGYGINGVAVLVDTLTDNRNRTAGDVRWIFDKFGGSLGLPNSVGYLFEKKGILNIEKEKFTEDDAINFSIAIDAEDYDFTDDSIVFYCEPNKIDSARKELENLNLKVIDAEDTYLPVVEIALNDEQKETFNKMIDRLDESDDVQNIYHNAILD